LSVLSFIAFLAVIIACLGLLGMAMSYTDRRRKEIGIRKVLGGCRGKLPTLSGWMCPNINGIDDERKKTKPRPGSLNE